MNIIIFLSTKIQFNLIRKKRTGIYVHSSNCIINKETSITINTLKETLPKKETSEEERIYILDFDLAQNTNIEDNINKK